MMMKIVIEEFLNLTNWKLMGNMPVKKNHQNAVADGSGPYGP